MMRIVAVLILLALIGAGAWYFFSHENAEIPLDEIRESLPDPRLVSFERSFADGTLTIEGEVSTVDACEEAAATAVRSTSGSVLVDVLIPPTEGPCLARKGTTTFSVSLEAPEDVAIEFLVNSTPPTVTAL